MVRNENRVRTSVRSGILKASTQMTETKQKTNSVFTEA